METKEITTVVEKITKQSEIDRLKLSDKRTLIDKITQKPLDVSVLPISRFGEIQIKQDEKIVYLGARDKRTNRFVERVVPGSEGHMEIVFKVNPTNKVYTYPYNSVDFATLVNNVDLSRLQELYTLSFEDLQATKVVLGLYKKKMAFAGSLVTEYEIDLFEVYTLSNQESYIMSTQLPGITSKHNEDGKVKFCVQDLDFKCLINKKGYNLPKDRTVKIGSKVKLFIKDQLQEGVIEDIIVSQMRYQDKNGRNIKTAMYVVVINGVPLRLKRKNFKLA